jgi:hypothetical protein
MQSSPQELPYVAVFRDGHFKDVFVRASDLPPIWTILPDGAGFTHIGLITKATYFLVEASSDGVGIYSTKTTLKER